MKKRQSDSLSYDPDGVYAGIGSALIALTIMLFAPVIFLIAWLIR